MYGPEYELNTKAGMIKNKNTQTDTERILSKVLGNLNNLNI